MEINGLTASSEATGFPKENLQHIWHTRCWRSTGVVSEWVKRNLWAAYPISYIIIKHHNFTDDAVLRLQANTIDNWAAPPLNDLITITDGQIINLFSPAENYQWWRIIIADPGNTDEYLKIGRLYIGGYFEPVRNYGNRTTAFIDPSTKKFSSGGQLSADKKSHFNARNYDFRIASSSDLDTLKTIFDTVGQAEPYFICEAPSPPEDAHESLYYVANTTPWTFNPIEFAYDYYDFTLSVETMR